MRLVSSRDQEVTIGGESIAFEADERLVTEHCHKYTPQSFAALAASAGWRVRQAWTDAARRFQVQYLHDHNDA